MKCLKLNGFQPKTIEAYLRAIRRIGNYFDCRIDNLTSDQLLDYFNELLDFHSWSTLRLDRKRLKKHLVQAIQMELFFIKTPRQQSFNIL